VLFWRTFLQLFAAFLPTFFACFLSAFLSMQYKSLLHVFGGWGGCVRKSLSMDSLLLSKIHSEIIENKKKFITIQYNDFGISLQTGACRLMLRKCAKDLKQQLHFGLRIILKQKKLLSFWSIFERGIQLMLIKHLYHGNDRQSVLKT